ncbi:phosphate-starvation-inducible protein PsiE [Bacillus sp. M6-12]|uniref:phosphate-starvation-inducible protein PsiE n=1 Tax=Bacillus sp. M6-12 TaxID=2054166 RepID=UPI000C7890F0|nr:phosphate-starvation-inducible protein PsiE [Bacillus sp. M6-12]PLS19687.1 phosphate-starvation-inducible protein PsiE [Bacillus sp. M6-12]
MENKQTKRQILLNKSLQYVLNISLILLSFVLIWLLGKEGFHLIHLTFFEETKEGHKEVLESILTFFLYFEFLSMIIKYFQEDYHFPLRYFMYIGITATIRLIVVDHEDAKQTLYFSGSILLLVISYAILTLLSIMKKKANMN